MGVGPDEQRVLRGNEVAERLAEAGVEAVALGFVDPSAIVRVKCVPVRRYAAAVRDGIGLSTIFANALSNDQFTETPGYVEGPSGDLRLVPDPDATVPLAAMPGWGWAPVDQYTQEGDVWGACPRSFLRRVLATYAERGLEVQAAFEFEFSLGIDDSEGGVRPAHEGPGYSATVLVEHHELALDMIRALEAQAVEIEQFHPEYTDGQFEVSIAPRDPLQMADLNLVFRQTIRAVARRHGWKVSFSPRTFGDVGNGMHLHLSLWRDGRNLMSGGEGAAGMTAEGEAFTAGLLHELPALVAVTCPNPLSYERLQPHRWSGATRCWGVENREAALRFITGMVGTRDAAANIEMKPVDATCNPYLAMGAVLAAGLAGVDDGLTLPPSTEEDPSSLPGDVKAERGVEPLPRSLPQAIDALVDSGTIRAAMGDLLFETFIATRRGDVEHYADLELDEVIAQVLWKY